MNTQSVDGTDVARQEGKLAVQVAVEIIRSKSASGKLASREDIFQDLLDRHLLNVNDDEAQNLCEGIIQRALEENEDLVKLHIVGAEPHFFSSQFMTEAYARILMQKESDPVLLIAEIVRQNSAIYPRPVPLGALENSPFDLTKEEIQDYVSRMA